VRCPSDRRRELLYARESFEVHAADLVTADAVGEFDEAGGASVE